MFILHVGRHKCGSSSIQMLLSRNADRLREHGIIYPRTARPNSAHHPLAKSLRSGGLEELNEIVDLKRRHPSQKLILSSEELGTLPLPRIAELEERIGACEALIVIYIRDLIGWLPSKYNEMTKAGASTCDFDRFFDSDQRSNAWSASLYCEHWASVFGWRNLRVRSIDSRSLEGGTLIEDFLSILGLSPADLGNTEEPGQQARNMSVGWKELEVLRAQFSALGRRPEHGLLTWEHAARIRNFAVEVLAGMGLSGQRAQYLSARQSEAADRQYRLDLQRLNDSIAGPKLPLPDTPVIMERPFLPALDRIPMDERMEIARRMERPLLINRGVWHRRFAQAGLGSEVRRCIIDAVVCPAAKSPHRTHAHPVS